MSDHFERMIRLATEFFSTKNDPEQLDVTPEVMEQLEHIHTATLSEEIEGDGPVVWILLIPTTADTMQKFLSGHYSESQLLSHTRPGETFTCIYLCSALVLPEFRRQGRAFRTALHAIREIRKDHPIEQLYCWSFSQEGKALAHQLAETERLPLSERPEATRASSDS